MILGIAGITMNAMEGFESKEKDEVSKTVSETVSETIAVSAAEAIAA